MVSSTLQKRKFDDRTRDRASRPKKRVRKQKEYYSSSGESEGSEDGFTPVNLNDSDEEDVNASRSTSKQQKPLPEKKKFRALRPKQDSSDDLSSEDDSDDGLDGGIGTGPNRKAVSKRNDPEAFSTSMSKILSTKLSQAARNDPVLSRSREAVEASSSIANEKLERKAKAKLRAERKEELERGRVKDVLGLSIGKAGETAEEEKRLRKVAQRGVVKLFNAVRAAQVRGEEAAKEERKKGTIGMAKREEKATEMSKQGFLDLINGSTKSKRSQEG